MAEPGDAIRVTNKGKKAFTDSFDGRQYTIEPGSDKVVPYEAAALWFGDPRAIDTGQVKTRLEEFRRLRVKYGAYENEDAWNSNKPNVKITTLDGDKITSVIDDPEGKEITPQSTTVLENQMMGERLANLEREISHLRSQTALETQTAQDRAEQAAKGNEPNPNANPNAVKGKGKPEKFGSVEIRAEYDEDDDEPTVGDLRDDAGDAKDANGDADIPDDGPTRPGTD